MSKNNNNRTFYDYKKYVRKYAQLSQIFYLGQNLLYRECDVSPSFSNTLILLNKKREDYQEMAGKLNSSIENVCSKCETPCCSGFYNHYTATDYWLRKYSDSPLSEDGIEVYNPWYNILIKERFGLNILPTTEIPRNGCSHLSDKGCDIELINRPIKCIAFTCRAIRGKMSKEQKKEYAAIIEGLYLLSCDVFEGLKGEAGILSIFGKFSVTLTP